MKIKRKTKIHLIHIGAILILIGSILSIFSVEETVLCFAGESTTLVSFAGEVYMEEFSSSSATMQYIVDGEVVLEGTTAVNEPLKIGFIKFVVQGTGTAKEINVLTGETTDIPMVQLLMRFDFSYYVVLVGMLMVLFSMIALNFGGKKK